jgi:hypothetical protein
MHARLSRRCTSTKSLGRRQVSHDCATPSASGDYVALSYHWGAEQSRTKQYQEWSVVEALPGTIGDAIKVTKALGKVHLWVDAQQRSNRHTTRSYKP